jgi:hypothetical protein
MSPSTAFNIAFGEMLPENFLENGSLNEICIAFEVAVRNETLRKCLEPGSRCARPCETPAAPTTDFEAETSKYIGCANCLLHRLRDAIQRQTRGSKVLATILVNHLIAKAASIEFTCAAVTLVDQYETQTSWIFDQRFAYFWIQLANAATFNKILV